MASPKGWRAIKTVWYVVWSGIFVFGCFVSGMVLLGFAGTENYAPFAGLFSLAVFWYAASTYRRKGGELMEEAFKEEHGKDEDEHSDDSF